MELTDTQFNQLTQGGECQIHSHPRHIMDADDFFNDEAAWPLREISANYTVRPNDGIVLVDTSAGNVTITLPHNDFNKEYQIVKVADPYVLTIVPTAPDTILGEVGVTVTAKLTSLHFKMDTKNDNWFLI